MNDNNKPDYVHAVAPWIRGRQIAVYLRGREKPMTGLTVCAVYPSVIVARWNSSTHLIANDQIIAIRFSGDCDPVRDRDHPLHRTTALKRSSEEQRDAPRPYPVPAETGSAPPERVPAFVSGRHAVRQALENTTESLTDPKQLSPASPESNDRSAQRVNTPRQTPETE